MSSTDIKIKAVIDYPEYVKLKNCLKTNKKENLAVKIANENLQLIPEKEEEQSGPVKASVFPGEEEEERKLSLGKEESPNFDLLSHVSSDCRDKAENLLKNLNLSNYEGGLFNLDDQTYNYEELTDIIKLLYGKGISKKKLKLDNKSNSFINSIKSRKGLKKFIKNKRVLNLQNTGSSSVWWNLDQ